MHKESLSHFILKELFLLLYMFMIQKPNLSHMYRCNIKKTNTHTQTTGKYAYKDKILEPVQNLT